MASYECIEIIGNISAVGNSTEIGSGAPYARVGVGVSIMEAGVVSTRWYSVILRGSAYDPKDLEKYTKGRMVLVKGKPRFRIKAAKGDQTEPTIDFAIFPTEPIRLLT